MNGEDADVGDSLPLSISQSRLVTFDNKSSLPEVFGVGGSFGLFDGVSCGFS